MTSSSEEKTPVDPSELTRALAAVSAGVPQADTRLLELVYGELKRIAAAKMAGQRPGHTLQPTALVNEAYVRLLGSPAGTPAFRGSAHFFTAAAAAMRSILVDHARRKQAQKRGAAEARITLNADMVGSADPLARILEVHEALERFSADHQRAARVVELLFFAGLSAEEAAGVLGVSERTIKRDWRFARASLLRAMEGG
jgi:RNA polymerase sigma factor (TIGR02999 family)